jgi:hypothetical protein
MKFDCKEISIDDDGFGCTLTFPEKEDKDPFQAGMAYDEMMSSMGQDGLIQRTYAEDESDRDYLHMETSDPDKGGELKDFSVNLYPTQFLMTCEGEIFEINLHINTREFERLKKILGAIINGEGLLIIHGKQN